MQLPVTPPSPPQRAPVANENAIPMAIDLALHVDDPGLVAALVVHADGADRERYALQALRIGALALDGASRFVDADGDDHEEARRIDRGKRDRVTAS